mmetsp:Transcript_21877/g.68740  ORF Transcript_21877/g.68740 Transcript_21877/m.68740 type:complete len:216 (-) Transcript_21877:2743-3390(-)
MTRSCAATRRRSGRRAREGERPIGHRARPRPILWWQATPAPRCRWTCSTSWHPCRFARTLPPRPRPASASASAHRPTSPTWGPGQTPLRRPRRPRVGIQWLPLPVSRPDQRPSPSGVMVASRRPAPPRPPSTRSQCLRRRRSRQRRRRRRSHSSSRGGAGAAGLSTSCRRRKPGGRMARAPPPPRSATRGTLPGLCSLSRSCTVSIWASCRGPKC